MSPDLLRIMSQIEALKDDEFNNIIKSDSRDTFAESIRIILSNLNFSLFNPEINKDSNNAMLIPSSVKGEGKTIFFGKFFILLSKKFKKSIIDWSG